MVIRLPSDLDVTDANNTTIPNSSGSSDNISEGNLPSTVNNCVRSLAAIVAAGWGSMYSGSTRPTAVQSGAFWRDTSGGNADNILYFYDGTDDIEVARVDITNNTFIPTFLNDLTNEATLSSGDSFPIFDASASAQRKVSFLNLVKGFGNLAGITPALADKIGIADVSAGTGGSVTVQELLETINLLAEDASPDLASDFLLSYDASATAVKKVQLSALGSTRQVQSAATTSGTSVTVSGITSGANKVIVLLDGVSTDGTSDFVLQIGDSGGLETTGYTGGTNEPGVTPGPWSGVSGARLALSPNASRSWYGKVEMDHLGSNKWAISISLSSLDGNVFAGGNGTKTLSAELTQVSITTSGGTDAFDSGTMHVVDVA